MGIFFALASCILVGIANVILKKSFKDFSPSIAFFILAIFSLLIWLPMGLILGVQFTNIFFGFFVGLISAALGQALYIYVLEKGEVSITATLLSTYSVYTIIFSMFFLGERPSVPALVCIALTIVGTIIVSLPERFDKKDFKHVPLILWGVVAAVAIGAADTLTKFYIDQTSVGSFLFYVSLSQLVVSLIYLRMDKQPLSQFKDILHKLREYKLPLLGSLFIAVATMFLFLSFDFTLASIASPIAASAPIVTVVLALIFLKEKITVKNWIGLVLVFISLIAIGIVNV